MGEGSVRGSREEGGCLGISLPGQLWGPQCVVSDACLSPQTHYFARSLRERKQVHLDALPVPDGGDRGTPLPLPGKSSFARRRPRWGSSGKDVAELKSSCCSHPHNCKQELHGHCCLLGGKEIEAGALAENREH